MTPVQIELSFEEFSLASDLPEKVLLRMVEEGILEPGGASPDRWRFESTMIVTARRASRLHRDLGIDWSGIALALELLEELERARLENRLLRQRLGRFIEEP
ncbi:chaperone modulator CbpM [Marinobacterium aestuariivivens]|uniref:Chaperone modulator CbpM n=1 Tax=Marinobacterium aestuariivivens TaxID=1698799 RepID=A0ABW1ZVW1_9GAMM